MEKQELRQLLDKYLDNRCTDEENTLLDNWYLEFELEDLPPLTDAQLEEIDSMQPPVVKSKKRPPLSFYILIGIAAALAITVISLAVWPQIHSSRYGTDIEPGSDQAVLTLSNGQKINLSDAKDGTLAEQGNVIISKSGSGELTFKIKQDEVLVNPTDRAKPTDSIRGKLAQVPDLNQLNSVTTPRGGQYAIVLPDGTKVWINAGSTLRFPSSFIDLPERRVELIGEAYFEVQKATNLMDKLRKRIPFIVKTSKQEVTVLGTHFNINCYNDEPNTKTTLLEGSVRIATLPTAEGAGAARETTIKPDQQAVLTGSSLKVNQIDADDAVAWKNGEFMFRAESLESIMRKISRWYGVDIVYEDKQVGKKLFGGTISKFQKVSEVLSMLELTGEVQFKIDDRTITVMR
jgi:transmembrane sensor